MRNLIMGILCFIPILYLGCDHSEKHQKVHIPPNTPRDEAALLRTFPYLNVDLQEQGIDFEQLEIFIRTFKMEQELELWAKNKNDRTFQLLYTYPFCESSGTFGPKRKEGDFQIPEGIYHISVYNPLSQFHLSLGINYPNSSDRFFSDKQTPGGDIYIHGNCVTIGCIPLTDPKIREVYTLANQAHLLGQEEIPVHIFPFKMESDQYDTMIREFPQHQAFWKSLQPIYQQFQIQNFLLEYTLQNDGYYHLP